MRCFFLGAVVFLSACATLPNHEMAEFSSQTVVKKSQVFIIYFDKDKKHALVNAINAHQDEIIYDYQNFSSLALKITADDMNARLAMYQSIDGVLQILEDRTLELH